MDRLDAMSMLIAVVDAGSFSGASRALKVPLATLSRRISELEAHLGVRLLLRTTRKLTLTEAGEAYVAAARRILEQVEEAERTAANELNEPKGELVITAPLLFGRLHVLPVLAEFLAAQQQISARLVLSDRHMDLLADHVDVAIRIGRLPNSSMVAIQVGSMRLVTCVRPELLRGKRSPRTPEALLQLPCIGSNAPAPVQEWRFREPDTGADLDMPVVPRLVVSTQEAAVDAAVMGVGVVRALRYQVAGALKSGDLKLILSDFEPEPLPVHLMHASRGHMPLKLRRFLDFAVPRLRAALK